VHQGSGNAVFAESRGSGAGALLLAGNAGAGIPLIARQNTSALRDVARFQRFGTVVASIDNQGRGEFMDGVLGEADGARAVDANRVDNDGDILVARNNADVEFRVESTGDVFADGAFSGGGADYAEWLPHLSAGDRFEPGDVVGVFGGRISHRTRGADQVMVISTDPVLVGNGADAAEARRDGHEMVAFIGQVPVNVTGPVQAGDFVVTSGRDDGTAVAVSPGDVRAEHLDRIIGTAWASRGVERAGQVNVVVGVDREAAAERVIARMRREADRRDAELAELHDRLATLEALAARLTEAR
jgi:hypothetical protein